MADSSDQHPRLRVAGAMLVGASVAALLVVFPRAGSVTITWRNGPPPSVRARPLGHIKMPAWRPAPQNLDRPYDPDACDPDEICGPDEDNTPIEI
ncbi:MAG TPA: hypothetical protein VFV07_09585 [Rhizomicrobium sp.]|nr:hypothetical protein [Rhizomicrobium sp.]